MPVGRFSESERFTARDLVKEIKKTENSPNTVYGTETAFCMAAGCTHAYQDGNPSQSRSGKTTLVMILLLLPLPLLLSGCRNGGCSSLPQRARKSILEKKDIPVSRWVVVLS
jgi:hypothetical protein